MKFSIAALLVATLAQQATAQEGFKCISEATRQYTNCVLNNCPAADEACTNPATGDADTCTDLATMCAAVSTECCPECVSELGTLVTCSTGGLCDVDCAAGTAVTTGTAPPTEPAAAAGMNVFFVATSAALLAASMV